MVTTSCRRIYKRKSGQLWSRATSTMRIGMELVYFNLEFYTLSWFQDVDANRPGHKGMRSKPVSKKDNVNVSFTSSSRYYFPNFKGRILCDSVILICTTRYSIVQVRTKHQIIQRNEEDHERHLKRVKKNLNRKKLRSLQKLILILLFQPVRRQSLARAAEKSPVKKIPIDSQSCPGELNTFKDSKDGHKSKRKGEQIKHRKLYPVNEVTI